MKSTYEEPVLLVNKKCVCQFCNKPADPIITGFHDLCVACQDKILTEDWLVE